MADDTKNNETKRKDSIMIVPSMTHEEVYAELDKDRDNLARWFSHQAEIYRRRALKTVKFPVTWWLDYTSPRKNRYLI